MSECKGATYRKLNEWQADPQGKKAYIGGLEVVSVTPVGFSDTTGHIVEVTLQNDKGQQRTTGPLRASVKVMVI